jgi:cardiolipin synthase
MIFIATIVFFERKSPSSTLAWILVLTFTPYIGFFLYLMFGLSFRKRFLVNKKKYLDLQRKAYLRRISIKKRFG